MPKLRTLSGDELIQALSRLGFQKKSQRGSHVKLVRGKGEILVIPMHRSIRKGTLLCIYKDVSNYIPASELDAIFFTE